MGADFDLVFIELVSDVGSFLLASRQFFFVMVFCYHFHVGGLVDHQNVRFFVL